jgi:hypothetical protein
MDLSTLVTACALTVDPAIMHALIWHQSGGEPWSITVPGECQSQVYRTLRDAVEAARDTQDGGATIRVGLAGLSADHRSVTAAMFAPCPNITAAARQIAQLAERCRVSARFNGDPIYCAIAAYRGSWDRPDGAFANAVKTSVAKNDAPDFEMPAQAGIDGADIESMRQPSLHDIATPPPHASDDHQRAWSSALFPAKSQQFDTSTSADLATGRPAADVHKSDAPSARQILAPLHANDLFVPRSAQRSPP